MVSHRSKIFILGPSLLLPTPKGCEHLTHCSSNLGAMPLTEFDIPVHDAHNHTALILQFTGQVIHPLGAPTSVPTLQSLVALVAFAALLAFRLIHQHVCCKILQLMTRIATNLCQGDDALRLIELDAVHQSVTGCCYAMLPQRSGHTLAVVALDW